MCVYLQAIPRDRRRTSAFSLVEFIIAGTILTVAIGAISTSLVATSALSRTNRETTLAMEGALSAIEAVRGEVFSEAFVRFNTETADDPAVGSSPGTFFAIPGLDVRSDDADGFVGQIFFPGDGLTLREDVVDATLGMPRDLNGDGATDALDHAADYVILPVRVRVDWTGKSGFRSIDFVSAIADF